MLVFGILISCTLETDKNWHDCRERRQAIYLNGNRLKEAARLRGMTREDVQKQSGMAEDDFAYFWDNPVTVPIQEDIKALAKALGLSTDILLVHGQPLRVALRNDKFSTE